MHPTTLLTTATLAIVALASPPLDTRDGRANLACPSQCPVPTGKRDLLWLKGNTQQGQKVDMKLRDCLNQCHNLQVALVSPLDLLVAADGVTCKIYEKLDCSERGTVITVDGTPTAAKAAGAQGKSGVKSYKCWAKKYVPYANQ
jgi:hypothetical protein